MMQQNKSVNVTNQNRLMATTHILERMAVCEAAMPLMRQRDTVSRTLKWGNLDGWSGFVFGHFLGGFEDPVPRLDNVTDDPRYSRLLADFSSVGGNVICNGSLS